MNNITPKNFTINNFNTGDTAISTSKQSSKVSTGNIEYDATRTDGLVLNDGKLVSFVNQDGNKVKVYVNNSILEKLNTKFGKDSFIAEDNNTLRAGKNAEEYLAGFWKIAQENILQADKDKNGLLADKELLDVRLSPSVGGAIDTRRGTFNVSIANEFYSANDTQIPEEQKLSLAKQIGTMSVDQAFSHLLAFDKNTDGNIANGELTTKQHLEELYDHVQSNDSITMMEEVTIGDVTVRYEEYGLSEDATKQYMKNKLKKEEHVLLAGEKDSDSDKDNTVKPKPSEMEPVKQGIGQHKLNEQS